MRRMSAQEQAEYNADFDKLIGSISVTNPSDFDYFVQKHGLSSNRVFLAIHERMGKLETWQKS